MQRQEFLTRPLIFYRSYSRFIDGIRENWEDTCDRTLSGLKAIGNLTDKQAALIDRLQREYKAITSGRFLWVGGTKWLEDPDNVYGAYNCSSTIIDSIHAIALQMALSMAGCGVGGMIEDKFISEIPEITTKIEVSVTPMSVNWIRGRKLENTQTKVLDESHFLIAVGDSRQGWVDAYEQFMTFAVSGIKGTVKVEVDLSYVRPKGETINGFGGVANAAKLPQLWERLADILNGAIGRSLNAEEICLLIDEGSVVVVAGNIRRCLPEDALVHTSKGLVPIKGIQIGDLVQTPLGFRKVIDKFDQGIQEVFEIKTDADKTARATLNHRMARVAENDLLSWRKGFIADLYLVSWKKVSGLTDKDFLIHTKTDKDGKQYDLHTQFKGINSIGNIQTYDIEVEDAHCFYCDGFLTHNSAGIKQFDASSKLLKTDLWSQNSEGNWVIDPKKDALRMSNHTRVYHKKPDRDSCIEAVRSQYFSGEGAIQWAGELVARCNADILDDVKRSKKTFLELYDKDIELAKGYLATDMLLDPEMTGKTQEECDREASHRMLRYGLNPCGEIGMVDNFCNLGEVHLNMLDPNNLSEQDETFYAAGVSTAVLLHHKFPEERYQYSRNVDPIVGVSFTGLFDFFVNRFGVDWLRWWEAGRPSKWGDISDLRYDGSDTEDFDWLSDFYLFKEQEYLQFWKESAFRGVYDYCDRNNLRRPNRCTTVQPSGSKSLLTNASPGWHPPKASRYIRRMTFARDHSIASAAIAYGYSVIPSQSDKDENGQLLNDPFDPRCTEWLVEVPIETSWANLEGAADIDISKFSALAQFDFYMQVQKHYTRHNTSATIELRESEIELVGDRVYQAIRDDEGYVSCAFLARFDDLQTFPRLPFEPIDKVTYDRLVEAVLERRTVESFADALQLIDGTQTDSAKKQEMSESGPAGCDSDKCLFPNVVVSG